jgi:PAS domain S-box-containing protein
MEPDKLATTTRDLTQRPEQEQALRENEERFRSLVQGVKDYAIFMLDKRGFITTWNAGARAIKGYEAGEIIGSHFSRFYPAEALARHLPDEELRVATIEGRFEDEGWRLRKDGSRFWANVVITAIRDEAGTLTGFSKITRDLTERRRHEEALRASEERFRLLVDGVTEYAIIMLDQNGAVSSWNAGAQRIKGYSAAEILGRHCACFFTPEDIAANRPWLELSRARLEGQVLSEGWRVRKDKSLFWAGSVITALQDSDGQFYGFAKLTQDLTQKRHAENLANTAQRMNEFIAMLAHELRNPLAPIRNAVELMRRKGLSDATLESMRQTIDRQSAHLSRLLDDLLDANRISRGQFSLDRSIVDLREVLARSIESSRPLIESHAHRLTTSIPPQPLIVEGDAVRLTQALVNLLNNAAKYTPDGGRIDLSIRHDERDVEISVQDNGRGIAAEELERIFDLFVQVDAKAAGGLGIGLALVRRIVDLHRGFISARSDGLGRGSTFTMRLPLTRARPVVPDAQGAQPAAGPARRLRLLVVDDNADAADSLGQLLRAMGHEVRILYDGRTVPATAQTFAPHAIFLDIGMPHVSGLEIARTLKGCKLDPVPVLVAVTGWGQAMDRERSKESGFDHHFVKPISETALAAVLEGAAGAEGPRRPI